MSQPTMDLHWLVFFDFFLLFLLFFYVLYSDLDAKAEEQSADSIEEIECV